VHIPSKQLLAQFIHSGTLSYTGLNLSYKEILTS
jgi:hypothetical protein